MKPGNRQPVAGDDRPVVIRWHEERNTKAIEEVAEILADILDNKPAPDEGRKS
jgi:hypothetical protein